MPLSPINQMKDSFFYKAHRQQGHFDFRADDFKLNQLDAEFASMYQLFISNKTRWENDRQNEIVLMVDALCDLMIQYYESHFVQAKLDELKKKKREITIFRNNNPLSDNQNDKNHTGSFLSNSAIDKFLDFARSLISTAKLNDHLSRLDDYRTYWNNCHNLAHHVVLSLQPALPDFIEGINRKLGNHYSTDDFLQILNKPNNFLSALSVGIYSSRFMINLVVMCKYTIQAHLGKQLSSEKVFLDELEQRGFTMLNDIVWGTVNLLIYRQEMFRLSTAAIVNTVAVSLVFNVALVVTHWLFDATRHHQRIQELEKQTENLPADSQKMAIIKRQMDILQDEWDAQSAYYAFNFTAACCQAVGFGVIFLLFGSLSLTYVFSMMLGSALYATANEFKQCTQANLAVQRELLNGQQVNDPTHRKLLTELTVERHNANAHFWKNLVYNTAGPTFIVTVTAISWPAALLITAAYLAYQSTHTNQQKRSETNEDKPGIYRLFTPPPEAENHDRLTNGVPRQPYSAY
ncbi:TPA: hypothetical protein ACPSKB_000954 [Legionella feeleii]